MSRLNRARMKLAKYTMVIGIAFMFAVDIVYCAAFRVKE